MAATKTVIITGGNLGLGFECAKAIAHEDDGWHIVLACRSQERGEEAARLIKESLPSNKKEKAFVECMILDLNSHASVRNFANALKTRLKNNELPPFRSLVCNAGLQNTSLKFTEDGYEQTFGVNHLGHFLLALLLADRMVAPARIVMVSSGTHNPLEKTSMPDPVYVSAEKLAHPEIDVNQAGLKFGQLAYTTSKLCNVLFAYELNRRLLSSGLSTTDKLISVNAFDPGLMPGTGLARDFHWIGFWIWKNILPHFKGLLPANTHTTQESGSALAAIAVKPQYQDITAKYFNLLNEKQSAVLSYHENLQRDLWSTSVKLCNLQQDETSLPLE